MLTHWVIITSFISVQENPKIPDLARHEHAIVRATSLKPSPNPNKLQLFELVGIEIATAMPYIADMLFIETSKFTELVQSQLNDDEYAALQWMLLERPDAGAIVPGSGGVRKLRWGLRGKGKRGGIRVIYYWKTADDEIWLLTLYAKNVRENIPANLLKQIAQEIDDD